MKSLFTTLFVCMAAAGLWAQHRHTLAPCGTAPGKSAWLKAYQANPARYQIAFPRNTTYVPLTVHLVGASDSLSFPSRTAVLRSLCQLNEDYAGTDMQFFLQDSFRYIANSAFNNHAEVSIGGQFMLQHNVANTINVYVVDNPAGNCGYNLPYAGIAMGVGCLNGHTFAHEMGHNLKLPHTFLGWEGGVSHDGSIAPNFGQSAPTEVYIDYTDFKDTVYTDTTIIDTILVEYVDRSINCQVAADGFCDTEPDYLAYRWSCNSNGLSTVQQKDPAGVAFYSEGANIMSYANDACQSVFSAEQVTAMRTHLLTERSNLLGNQSPMRDSVHQTNLVYPVNLYSIPGLVEFKWNATPNATHYIISVQNGFGQNVLQKVVTDTSYQLTTPLPPRPSAFNYRWEVQAFNQGYFCATASTSASFNVLPSATHSADASTWSASVFPNPTGTHTATYVSLNLPKMSPVSLQVVDIMGRQVYQQHAEGRSGKNEFALNLEKLSVGTYYLQVTTQLGTKAYALQIK